MCPPNHQIPHRSGCTRSIPKKQPDSPDTLPRRPHLPPPAEHIGAAPIPVTTSPRPHPSATPNSLDSPPTPAAQPRTSYGGTPTTFGISDGASGVKDLHLLGAAPFPVPPPHPPTALRPPRRCPPPQRPPPGGPPRPPRRRRTARHGAGRSRPAHGQAGIDAGAPADPSGPSSILTQAN